MASLWVKLVRGLSGHPERHRQTVRGLGLTRVGRERILPDTPAIRGMVSQVGYLLEWEAIEQPFQPFGRKARARARTKSGAATAGQPASSASRFARK